MNKKHKAISVTGPTATGKTSLAVKLARKFAGEIISVDSRQVYRGMDIGTGKDLEEYAEGGTPVPYHLIDVAGPGEVYHLKAFHDDATRAAAGILQRKKLPVFAGGTALYLHALLTGYELPGGEPDAEMRREFRQMPVEELQNRLQKLSPGKYAEVKDKNNRIRLTRALEKILLPADGKTLNRPEYDMLVLGVYFPRKVVHQRIEERLARRLQSGMIEEVENLHKNGVSWQRLDDFGLEYRYLALYLQNKLSYNDMREQLLAKIRRLAKSQDVWFRKMEREGIVIHWIPEGDFAKASTLVNDFLAGKELPGPEISMQNLRYGPRSDKKS